jgi:hypothetical protein
LANASTVEGAMTKSVNIKEPAIFIRISQMYTAQLTTEALYEATRGVWVIGNRRINAKFAFAVADGIIREIYEIDSWHPAATTPYMTRPIQDVSIEGRHEFVGTVAPAPIREKYIDCSVAHYFKKGAANPIMYVNI